MIAQAHGRGCFERAVGALLCSLLSLSACSLRSEAAYGTRDRTDDHAPARPGSSDAAPATPALLDAALPDAASPDLPNADAQVNPDTPVPGTKPIVIVMIGDGMGRGQLEAASLYAAGAPDKLFMHSLPYRGEVTTGGPSGITDSAAAATVMATGVYTYNSQVGIDRDGQERETLIELAHTRGLVTGVVSTASLPHATPGSFSAHDLSRHNYVAIADDQITQVQPHVMLGGGARYYFADVPGSLRKGSGLSEPLAQARYHVVRDAAGLSALTPKAGARVFGAFAADHMSYVRERAADTAEPTLKDMSLAALNTLDLHPGGFFLMIEGARIDMASHNNDLANTVAETLALDDTVAAVAAWAGTRQDVTLIVTADHECGGLTVERPHAMGVLPDVSWRWLVHTNARVDVFAQGPGAEVFDDALRDQRWVYAVSRARLTGEPLVTPPRVAIPDGHLADLRYHVSTQTLSSGFGPGRSQLDGLYLDADRYGLSIGVEGLFAWDDNAVLLLLDVDFGSGTGHASLSGALQDEDGKVDAILSASNVTTPATPGFGADFAVVSLGGADPQLGELRTDGGLRGLRAPFGSADNLGWHGAALNFGEGVRTRAVTASRAAREGFEVFIPWDRLYPAQAGRVPQGAELAISALLVNNDGGFTSNQALPPFVQDSAMAGRTRVALPGVAVLAVDSDRDGVVDGELSFSVRAP